MNPQAPLPGAPASPYPDLQKYYDLNFQLPLSNAGMKVAVGQADATNQQNQYDIKNKASTDYKRLPKADGGYTFVDPQGNEISAHDYARATGKDAASVLDGSENPIDIGFQQDYKNLQDFMNVATSGDKQALQDYYSQNPGLKNLSPQEVLTKFRQAYPTVYGGTKNGNQPVNSTLIPNLDAIRNNQDYAANGAGGIVGG